MKTSEELTMLTPADHVPGPQQGKWTYDSYAALPDDGKRYEIVDGVLYMVPAPNDFHQEIVALIISYLIPYIKHTGRGRVLGAPIDVVLEPGTVVQPDVLVLLEEKTSRRKPAQTTRPPDLAIEVASPDTARYDRRKKYDAYAHAGVKEYWIVDPTRRTVEAFLLEGNEYHLSGIFRGEQTIPSLIVPDFSILVQRFFE
jgi:Uma2 family endonuclease